MKTWKIRSSNHASARSLADALGIPLALARILVSRSYGNAEAASAFLYASMEELSRPFELPNMGAAVERIGQAIQAGEKIAVYGDYDVDGICSTTLLHEAFRWFGVDVRLYIPSRFKEGYGMNAGALETLLEEGISLVVTVDNGIAAADLVDEFSKKGLDFIVTDHHQLPDVLPDCIVVNPLMAPSRLAKFRRLCGCGTAYMLAMGMLIRLAPDWYDDAHRRTLLDLVAVATVADMVPLLDDNRILVREGLKYLNDHPRPGMQALVSLLCGEDDVRTSDIAFRIAPCINACGRLDKTDAALRLFTATTAAGLESLAEEVRDYNNERKEIERILTREAIGQFTEFTGRMHCAIAVGHNWHPGVIGIVASRLVEQFHCPAIVLTNTEEEPSVYTGSARSVPGFHLYEGLKAVSDHLIRFGGHEMAAGLSVHADELAGFKAAFERETAGYEEAISENILWIDDILKIDEVTDDLETALRLLEPCGCENPEPLFALEHQWRFSYKPVGKEGEHLRLGFENSEGDKIPAIAFRKGNYEFSDRHRYDFAFHIGENCYRGLCSVQLQITDIQPAWQAEEDRVRRTFMEAGENYTQQSTGIADQAQFYTKVRGVSYAGRQDLIATLKVGEGLLLLREANNPADGNAVACLTEKGEKIGYLSRQIAAQLAPLMDLGATYEAYVEEVTGSDEQTHGVNIFVRSTLVTDADALAKQEAVDLNGLETQALVDVLTDAFVEDGELLPIQRAAIENIITRHEDTAVIMPTGRGKSLIYQVAAGVLARREQRMTLVISPLKALIQDQYLALSDRLSPLGYRVYKGNGDLSREERQALYDALEAHEVDILLLTPEFFVRHQSLFSAHAEAVGQIVIDEAHYMTSKREAYKRLPALKGAYPFAVWTYLTATVPSTEASAFAQIISGAGLYIDDHIRYNLHIIDARHTERKLVSLYRLFMHPEKTICYVNSRKQAFGLSQRLREILPYQLRTLVGYYHGGLPQQARRAVERAFKEGEIRLLFATTAFGEGVHIPDIRNVVLYHPCFSVESFNQLAGRCARDGEPGHIHLMYSERDFALNEMIISERGPSRNELGQMYQCLKRYGSIHDDRLCEKHEDFWNLLTELVGGTTKGQWQLALKIFEELQFLRLTRTDENIILDIENNPTHRSLTDSPTYLEGMSEKRALEQFKEIAFNKDLGALEAVIRSALRPANWQGREVKT